MKWSARDQRTGIVIPAKAAKRPRAGTRDHHPRDDPRSMIMGPRLPRGRLALRSVLCRPPTRERNLMSIKIGDRLPETKFRIMTPEGPAWKSTSDIFGGKKVVLFAVPGDFTSTS